MAIVDFHSHFFCRTYFKTLAGMSKLPGDVDARMAGVAGKVRIELPPDDVEQHLARWISELDRHGVEHMATFASVPEELPDVVRAARASKGRLSAFALVNPRVEGAAAKLDRALAAGDVRGALVFPALHHYELSGPEAAEVFGVLDAHGAIVFVHCGILVVRLRDLFGLPRVQDVRFANPLSLIPAANAHPRATFVVPHFGAGLLRETLIAGAQCPNVHVDTSSSNGWMATQESKLSLRDVCERALGVFGASRILFGTDSNTFPAGWRRDRYEEQVAAFHAAGASILDQEKIFAANARRLLKLDEA